MFDVFFGVQGMFDMFNGLHGMFDVSCVVQDMFDVLYGLHGMFDVFCAVQGMFVVSYGVQGMFGVLIQLLCFSHIMDTVTGKLTKTNLSCQLYDDDDDEGGLIPCALSALSIMTFVWLWYLSGWTPIMFNRPTHKHCPLLFSANKTAKK